MLLTVMLVGLVAWAGRTLAAPPDFIPGVLSLASAATGPADYSPLKIIAGAPCYPNPCRNSGVCVVFTEYNEARGRCECQHGYSGLYCEIGGSYGSGGGEYYSPHDKTYTDHGSSDGYYAPGGHVDKSDGYYAPGGHTDKSDGYYAPGEHADKSDGYYAPGEHADKSDGYYAPGRHSQTNTGYYKPTDAHTNSGHYYAPSHTGTYSLSQPSPYYSTAGTHNTHNRPGAHVANIGLTYGTVGSNNYPGNTQVAIYGGYRGHNLSPATYPQTYPVEEHGAHHEGGGYGSDDDLCYPNPCENGGRCHAAIKHDVAVRKCLCPYG